MFDRVDRAVVLDAERRLHCRPAQQRAPGAGAQRGVRQPRKPARVRHAWLWRALAGWPVLVRQPQERPDLQQPRRARLDAAALPRAARVLLTAAVSPRRRAAGAMSRLLPRCAEPLWLVRHDCSSSSVETVQPGSAGLLPL